MTSPEYVSLLEMGVTTPTAVAAVTKAGMDHRDFWRFDNRDDLSRARHLPNAVILGFLVGSNIRADIHGYEEPMELAGLIETYRDALVGLIASWGPRGADAASLAQDSFAEAYLRRASCRGDWRDPEVFGPWLRGVARNVVRNWNRSERRRSLRVVTSEAAVHAAQASEDIETDRVVALRKAIRQLPRKQREVVLMHYTGNTPVADIATLLAITPRAVEGRLYQARRSLRRLLNEQPTSLRGVLLCL